MSTKPLVVGLTGGIGSGKTMVSNALSKLGAEVYDADVIAHELCAPGGAAIAAIAAQFGPSFINAEGAMDRNAMRKRVFDEPHARKDLEQILHPLIRTEIVQRIEHCQSSYCVLVIPLLVEKGGWNHLTDCVVVVDCEPAQQIERVAARNGWPVSQIQQVLAAQATREERLQVADYVVNNHGSPEAVLHQSHALHDKLRMRASELKEQLRKSHI